MYYIIYNSIHTIIYNNKYPINIVPYDTYYNLGNLFADESYL